MTTDRLANWLPDTLRCLLSFDKETSRWVGKCLDLGLTTSGKTEKITWDNLGKVVKAHVETCWRQNRKEALMKHRASQVEFASFETLQKKNPGKGWRDKITFDLIEPETGLGPVWMEALELLPQGTGCDKAASAVVLPTNLDSQGLIF